MATKDKNLPEWKLCETEKRIEYEQKGCLVVSTGRGSDFFVACPDQKSTFVEVKNGCGGLTEFQRETRKNALESGFGYNIERCACKKRK